MPVVCAPIEPTHDLGDTRFTSLATPSTGTTDTAVWRVELAPGTPATPHTLTREEVLVVLSGVATVRIGEALDSARAGDAIVVPAGAMFELSNWDDEPLRMICCMPVGGGARTADGTVFTPPWAT
jgi:mannose-6-phosphate isomerase-like protein (cupin superfamily)